MGYVGNQTTNSYTSMDKQTITGNGGTSYTLDHAVANVNEIEVFVNNVRQEPSVAYTVSGTALTMTGNVAASDDFYVVFQGKAIQTVVPPDDSVTTARINDGAVTTDKIADDAVTSAKINDVTTKQATENTPMFAAYLSAAQTLTTATWTKIQLDTEYSGGDPESEFDTANNRYTPSVAGWYHFTLNTSFGGTGGTMKYTSIVKNTTYQVYTEHNSTTNHRVSLSQLLYLNGTTDFVEFHAYTQSTSTPKLRQGANETQAFGFLVRAD